VHIARIIEEPRWQGQSLARIEQAAPCPGDLDRTDRPQLAPMHGSINARFNGLFSATEETLQRTWIAPRVAATGSLVMEGASDHVG
jgi:hypothetical protein